MIKIKEFLNEVAIIIKKGLVELSQVLPKKHIKI